MFKLDVIKAITSVKIGSVQHVKLRPHIGYANSYISGPEKMRHYVRDFLKNF